MILPRLLVSDVDGTLVDRDKRLSPRAIAAVKALGKRGVRFTLTSSRPPRGLQRFVEPLELDLPLGGVNGGAIVLPDMSPLEAHTLEPRTAQDARAFLGDAGLDVWVYTEADWIVPRGEGPHVARERFILGYDPVVRDPTPADLRACVKIVGVSDDHGRMAEAARRAAALFEGRASASNSEPHFLDVTDLQANKGAFVDWLCGRLELAPKDVAVIGDGANDVAMFAHSGFSIAMGNADAAVRRAATAVTAGNEADGFAQALEALLEGRPVAGGAREANAEWSA